MAIDYLGRIRSFLAALPETIDAFLVVTGDPWGSEYLPDHWALRAHLTGFTGSAGTLLLCRAAPHVLWTDSRYTLAATERCRALGLVFCEEHRALDRELPDKVRGLAVGFDPETLSEAEVRRLEAAFEEVGARLIALPDALRTGWPDERPAEVAAPLFRIDPPEASGLRLARLRETMEEGESTLIGPEETAWFTHLRAFDVACNTTPHVRLWVPKTGEALLLADSPRLNAELLAELAREGIRVGRLSDIPRGTLLADPARLPSSLWRELARAGFTLCETSSPVPLWMSVKCSKEIRRTKRALLEDARAQIEWMARLEERLAAGERLTEWDAARMLIAERRKAKDYLCESFDPIVAFGLNAALPHYKTAPDTAAPIDGNGLLLVDSGMHSRLGTTDTTRMFAVGTPPREALAASTRVLQGMLALARARFTAGTPAVALDALARAPLWAAGLDFGHGTGHGIGFAQSVHEGPLRISPRALDALPVNATVSDEPGYYAAGRFGIRWENTLRVVPDPEHEGFLAFETLTRLPLARGAFDPSLLSEEEIRQIDIFHARVREELLTLSFSEAAEAWLLRETRPLGKDPS